MQPGWSNKSDPDRQKIDSSIQFISALSPFMARDFLTFMVYSLSHYDTFFSTGPTEFFLFLPVSLYKQIVSKPTRNLNHYTAFTIYMNSLFDYGDIDLFSAQIKGVERVKIENKMSTVVNSDFFTFTNDRSFKTKEDFILIRIKPKEMVKMYESEFLINYV